jgi:uncharacterized protein (TIGR00730 family)
MVASWGRQSQKGASGAAVREGVFALGMPVAARAVAVFCGSRTGHDPAALTAARALGQGLAASGITLVYGGGRVGLMGAVADAALAGGGRVIGVIPDFLTRREVAHEGLTELHITDSMHSRKQLMFTVADAFVTLPGGFGTLDETMEILTWAQLDQHGKPVFICNIGGWAAPLLAALRATVAQGYASAESLELFEVVDEVPALLARLRGIPHIGGDAARL